MLISAVIPIMSIYRLPQGQYGYTGHVINLPQDVASFARQLPRLTSHLDVIVVRKEGSNQSHRDFHVRRGVVHRALQWLVVHNMYYRSNNVTIDMNSLAQLPEDETLSNLTTISVDIPESDIPNTSEPPLPNNSSDDNHFHLPQSFVPIANQSLTEQEAVQQEFQQRQSCSARPAHTTMMWPSIGGIPINEFTTEGYFTCAFPTLFPTGAADFLGQ